MIGKYPHPKTCKCAKGGSKSPLNESHDWWIRSKEHHNCFWVYLRANKRAHTLNEISKLLNLSISAVTSIEKKAELKLKRKFRMLIY